MSIRDGAPLAIDLFCGLGGWTEGLLAEGYDVVGFDIERHVYGEHRYPAQLVLQDVLMLHGSQFRNAALIVASPPCQAYSYRAMPWSRAKALPPPDNSLFDACFRIQREACEAAGHHIPMVVENVRGAQKWVGRSRWNYGSFHLWGDVPALMPMRSKTRMKSEIVDVRHPGCANFHQSKAAREGVKVSGLNFANYGKPGYKAVAFNDEAIRQLREGDHIKQAGISGPRNNGKGDAWFQDGAARHGSKSNARKAASAMIAKIPLPLAQYIARVYRPERLAA